MGQAGMYSRSADLTLCTWPWCAELSMPCSYFILMLARPQVDTIIILVSWTKNQGLRG